MHVYGKKNNKILLLMDENTKRSFAGAKNNKPYYTPTAAARLDRVHTLHTAVRDYRTSRNGVIVPTFQVQRAATVHL